MNAFVTLLFDENFGLIDYGWEQVGSGDQMGDGFEKLDRQVDVKDEGYMYIYPEIFKRIEYFALWADEVVIFKRLIRSDDSERRIRLLGG